MDILEIATIGHPILREKAKRLAAEEIADPKTQAFIDAMIATMRKAQGAGLAANQVYHGLQICTIEVGNNRRYPYKPPIPLQVLINPTVTPCSEATFLNFEGCLSVPNLRGRVRRFLEVEVDAQDRLGKPLKFMVRGLSAGTYQHELDHLDGKLFIDKVEDPTTLCTWEHFAHFHQESFSKEAAALVAQWGS